jgi:hypothetical protein
LKDLVQITDCKEKKNLLSDKDLHTFEAVHITRCVLDALSRTSVRGKRVGWIGEVGRVDSERWVGGKYEIDGFFFGGVVLWTVATIRMAVIL